MSLRVESVVRPHLMEEEEKWLPWVERCLMQAAEGELDAACGGGGDHCG